MQNFKEIERNDLYMKMKSLQEKRIALVGEMEALMNVEVREGEEAPVIDVEKFNDLKSQVEVLDAEIKAIKDLEIIKNAKPVGKAEKGQDEEMVEIRELIETGIEIREGEIVNSNIGAVDAQILPGVLDKVVEISPLYASANKANITSTTAYVKVQGTKLPKFVKRAELEAYTKAQATFTPKTLTPEVYGLAVFLSEECLDDNAYVTSELEKQFLEGVGLTCNELVANTLEAATGAVVAPIKLDTDGLTDMYFALKPGYRAGAKFVINPEMERQIAKLKDSTGQPLMIRTFADRPVFTILGCEVIVDENVTKPMFVNMQKAITVGLRRQFRIEKDSSVGFLSGSIAYRADIRLDAVTTIEEAIVIGQVSATKSK